MNHTKGPWSLGDIDGGHIDIDALDACIPHTGLATVVWKMSDEDSSPDCEANAHLIAAAPELLEALISMANRMESIIMEDGSTPCTIKARAAIAKATGAA